MVLCVIAVYEVLHDASGFEEIDLLAVGEAVGKCGDAAIWVDR
jgi:hypothetical protein